MKYTRIVLVLLLLAAMLLCACGEKEFGYMTADLGDYVELGEYKGLKLTYEVKKVTEEDIELALLNFREELAEFEEYTELAEGYEAVAYDYLAIDFVGYMNGEVMDDATAEGQYVLLCENNGYIDWFEDDLYGAKVGDTVISTGNFPEDYYEELAGKEITFHITVKGIAGHYNVPELTDELVAENTDFDTVEKYRLYLADAIGEERRAEASANVYGDLWEILMENSKVLKYPEQPLQDYYDMFYSYVEEYATYAGYEDVAEFMATEIGLTEEDLWEDARLSVFEDLIVFSIVQAEKMTFTDEEYQEIATAYAEQEGMTLSQMEELYGKDYLEECVLYDKAISLVYDSADIQYIEK